MNYRETRLKDETGRFVSEYQIPLPYSVRKFTEKAEKKQKKNVKMYLIFLWYFPFGILSEKQTAAIDERIQNQFQRHLLSLVRILKESLM